MGDKITTAADVERYFDALQERLFTAAEERQYEDFHRHTLTPEGAQAQRETIDAAQSLPWGATENSINREKARRNELQCRSVNVVAETRDRSETGGGSMTCAQWFLVGVLVACVVLLAILRGL